MSKPALSRPITSRKAGIAYNDIDALARHVDGFDATHYFDQQGEVETQAAIRRWPMLARGLGLPPAPEAPDGSGTAPNP
ncbi:BcsR/BcsP family cellulose biosynthesis protein [Cupriavidus agavae]|uniref:Cellulose biosynthesis protein BcsR n=1 Tax=Cupriavidus agavae TaxID=1001822 RepID=A0A4Q7S722_9BURK|nr:BcsR/BcsP family cellulose biosynthesis protein [Cupriavidus agavae]RZT41677.1 cellulose biosynthesis protein BcsR [Cupriavidus agavae]